MNNIFVEGIQGAGKSTLLNQLEKKIPEYQVYREGDLSPVELAWCSYMTSEQYEDISIRYQDIRTDLEQHTVSEGSKKITAYTHILTDIKGFHRYMEQFEIYNGRVDFIQFKKVILQRYSKFSGRGTICECSFFQNSIECMRLYYQMSDEEIIDFYEEAFRILISKNFRMLYINVADIESTIDTIKRERTDLQGNEIWFLLMIQYIETTPYGIKHNLKGFDGLVSHLKWRRDLEHKIIHNMIGKNAFMIESKNYNIEEIIEWCRK